MRRLRILIFYVSGPSFFLPHDSAQAAQALKEIRISFYAT